MAKRLSISNFIIVSILVAIGIFLSLFSFNMPFGSTDKFAGFVNAIPLGYDIGEGRTVVFECSPTNEEVETLTSSEMKDTAKYVENALNMFGYSYHMVEQENGNMLRVTVVNNDNSSEILQALEDRIQLVIRGKETTEKTQYDISADHIKKCSFSYQQSSSDSTKYEYGVLIEFDDAGTKLYRELTKNSKTVYFYNAEEEDAESAKIGTLSVKKEIATGQTFLANSSLSTEVEYNAYALQIYMGGVNTSFEIKENSVVSPIYGKNVGLVIKIALLISFVLVNLFMVLRYRDLGLMSFLSSLINAVLYMFLLQTFPSTFFVLTLGGVVGIVVGFLLTILCHIVVFEKIKKEYSLGRKIPLAIKLGFKQSLFEIVDICSLGAIASVVLYLIGATGLKSFAVTLLVGSVLAIVSSLLLTKLFTFWYLPINHTNEKHLALKKEANSNEQ